MVLSKTKLRRQALIAGGLVVGPQKVKRTKKKQNFSFGIIARMALYFGRVHASMRVWIQRSSFDICVLIRQRHRDPN